MPQKLQGQIRHLMSFVGGIVVGNGFLSADTVEAVIGVVLSVIPFAWSWIDKKNRF